MKIYKATNNINNKCYIGQTIQSLSSRMSCHKNYSLSRESKLYFHRAIRKYGWNVFEWEVLCECDTKEELDEMEYHYIKQFKSFGNGGYNLTEGGDSGVQLFGKDNGMFGRTHTKQAKDSISRKNKGNNVWLGRTHTRESKDKMSVSSIGKNKGKDNGWYGMTGNKNPLSKQYLIIHPDGTKKTITGLRQFCKDNKLTVSNMLAVSSKRQKQHKGYKCYKIGWIHYA